eukprot:4387639-Amphidinium_carterae.1
MVRLLESQVLSVCSPVFGAFDETRLFGEKSSEQRRELKRWQEHVECYLRLSGTALSCSVVVSRGLPSTSGDSIFTHPGLRLNHQGFNTLLQEPYPAMLFLVWLFTLTPTPHADGSHSRVGNRAESVDVGLAVM